MGLRGPWNRAGANTAIGQIRRAPAFCPSSLSTGPPPFKRRNVPGPISSALNRPISSALNRLVATLCVLLTFVYAATMPVKASNQIQHMMPATVAHQHSVLAAVPVDVDHDHDAVQADHGAPDPSDHDRSGGDANGEHHHHGDSGSNILLPAAATTPELAPSTRLEGLGTERAIAGLRAIEPERPPRLSSLNA